MISTVSGYEPPTPRRPGTAWLPLRRPDQGASGDPDPSESRLSGAPHQADAPGAGKQRLRLLIIEDNRDYADSLQLLFEIYGHEATAVYTGPAGLAEALRQPPDAIVCDIGLPGLDGYQLARALRQDPRTAGVYLVAVTGYGSDAARDLALESGFNAHLVKPAGAEDILRLLGRDPGFAPGN